MNELAQARARSAPDWLVAEMPQGYQTRVAEIQRLSSEIEAMDRIGRLLWEIGQPLADAVRDVFTALRLETEPTGRAATHDLTVKLDANRRLLLSVSHSEGTIQKKSPELARVFQTLHEFAGDNDRVVLVANGDRAKRPADRSEAITADALTFLRRMGANVLTAPALFKLWLLALQDQERARTYLERLHAQDGGTFQFPS